jgi:hypothetical protein
MNKIIIITFLIVLFSSLYYFQFEYGTREDIFICEYKYKNLYCKSSAKDKYFVVLKGKIIKYECNLLEDKGGDGNIYSCYFKRKMKRRN